MDPNIHNPPEGSPDDKIPKDLLRSKDTGKKQRSKQELVPWATESDTWSPKAQLFVPPDISAGQMESLRPLTQDTCCPLLPLPGPQLGLPGLSLSLMLQGPELCMAPSLCSVRPG